MNLTNYLASLENFLKKSQLYYFSNEIKKISMDIIHDEVRERVEQAAEERAYESSFDYSAIFPENQQYTIVDPVVKNLQLLEDLNNFESEVHSILNMFRSSILYLNNGNDITDAMLKDPFSLTIGGKKINITGRDSISSYSMRDAFVAAYTSIVSKPITSALSRFSYIVKEDLISYPVTSIRSSNPNSFSDFEEIVSKSASIILVDEIDSSSNAILDKIKDREPQVTITKDDIVGAIVECRKVFSETASSIANLDIIYNKIMSGNKAMANIIDEKEKLDNWKVLISYEPEDIATAAYQWTECSEESDKEKRMGTGWKTCINILDNDNLLRDIVEGGIVAYLVKSSDPRPSSSPRARIRIRHLSGISENPKDFVLQSESTVYGEDIYLPLFDSRILFDTATKWTEEANLKIENTDIVYNLSGGEIYDNINSMHINRSAITKNYENLGEYDISDIYTKIKNIPESEKDNMGISDIITSFSLIQEHNFNMNHVSSAQEDMFFGGEAKFHDIIGISRYDGRYNESHKAKSGDANNILSSIFRANQVKDIIELGNPLLNFLDLFSNYLKMFVSRSVSVPSFQDFDSQVITYIISIINEGEKNFSKEFDEMGIYLPLKKEDELLVEKFIDKWYLNHFAEKTLDLLKVKSKSMLSFDDKQNFEDSFDKTNRFISEYSYFCSSCDNNTIFLMLDEIISASKNSIFWKNKLLSDMSNSINRVFDANFDSDAFDDIEDSLKNKAYFLEQLDLIEKQGADESKLLLIDILRKYSDIAAADGGFIFAENLDDAKSKVSIIIGSDENLNVNLDYYILKISDLSPNIHYHFDDEDYGNFFYKRKVSSGGANTSSNYYMRTRINDLEAARQFSMLTGVGPDRIREVRGNFGIKEYIVR